MGNELKKLEQHNTHVANKTDETICIVLTDNDKRPTTQVIPKGKYECIPTPQGRVTLTVFREGSTTGEATYTDDSDRSFIVKKVDGKFNVVRTKYGTIWKEEEGLR